MRRKPFPTLVLIAATAGCTSAPVTPSAPGTAPAGAPAGEFNVLGTEGAPVTVIEFTDMQCPYCARYALQTFPQIRRNYVDTGKVRYAARDLAAASYWRAGCS